MSQGIDAEETIHNELDDSNHIVLFSGSLLSEGTSPFHEEQIIKDKNNM